MAWASKMYTCFLCIFLLDEVPRVDNLIPWNSSWKCNSQVLARLGSLGQKCLASNLKPSVVSKVSVTAGLSCHRICGLALRFLVLEML